jgi:hypothetical protein
MEYFILLTMWRETERWRLTLSTAATPLLISSPMSIDSIFLRLSTSIDFPFKMLFEPRPAVLAISRRVTVYRDWVSYHRRPRALSDSLTIYFRSKHLPSFRLSLSQSIGTVLSHGRDKRPTRRGVMPGSYCHLGDCCVRSAITVLRHRYKNRLSENWPDWISAGTGDASVSKSQVVVPVVCWPVACCPPCSAEKSARVQDRHGNE